MRKTIDVKEKEKHAERKNKPFYGMLGTKVNYCNIAAPGTLSNMEAFIIAIHDEEQGVVDLYLRELEDTIHTVVENYIENGETRHKMRINEKQFDSSRLIKNVMHKDFVDFEQENYWE